MADQETEMWERLVSASRGPWYPPAMKSVQVVARPMPRRRTVHVTARVYIANGNVFVERVTGADPFTAIEIGDIIDCVAENDGECAWLPAYVALPEGVRLTIKTVEAKR